MKTLVARTESLPKGVVEMVASWTWTAFLRRLSGTLEGLRRGVLRQHAAQETGLCLRESLFKTF